MVHTFTMSTNVSTSKSTEKFTTATYAWAVCVSYHSLETGKQVGDWLNYCTLNDFAYRYLPQCTQVMRFLVLISLCLHSHLPCWCV